MRGAEPLYEGWERGSAIGSSKIRREQCPEVVGWTERSPRITETYLFPSVLVSGLGYAYLPVYLNLTPSLRPSPHNPTISHIVLLKTNPSHNIGNLLSKVKKSNGPWRLQYLSKNFTGHLI